MTRQSKPTGLISYTSQNALAGKPSKLIRARTIVYPLIMLSIMAAFGIAMASKSGFDARVIRGKGTPFTFAEDRSVVNTFSIRLVNRSDEPQRYQFAFANPGLRVEVVDEEDLQLPAGGTALVPIFVRFDSEMTREDGNQRVKLTIRDSADRTKDLRFRVLGPR